MYIQLVLWLYTTNLATVFRSRSYPQLIRPHFSLSAIALLSQLWDNPHHRSTNSPVLIILTSTLLIAHPTQSRKVLAQLHKHAPISDFSLTATISSFPYTNSTCGNRKLTSSTPTPYSSRKQITNAPHLADIHPSHLSFGPEPYPLHW